MGKTITFLFRKQISFFAVFYLFGSFVAHGQFTITENFKNSTASNKIVLGGTPKAYLTAGQGDPEGEGWLRLTKAEGNQKGFAYIDEAFPSQLGVFVDFEFKAWRSVNDQNYGGADGFSVFLFDGSVPQFSLGGYGGSLGYAPTTPTVPTGLSGGYIGIGLDEYGNFSNPTEGRVGGPGEMPNSIVLRGPTTSVASTTNKYLAGYQLATGVNSNEGVDYNEIVAVRPDDNTFYRRIQISVTPENGQYHISVKMAKSPNGDFTEYINYTSPTPPPQSLKLGFAASTGGGFNYHEIRNLIVTTPGGARIDNTPSTPSSTVGSPVEFVVNAYNSTSVPLSDFLLTNTFYDGEGNVIPADALRIDNIEFLDNGNPQNVMTGQTIEDGKASATFNLDKTSAATGDAVGRFIIHATVLKMPAGGIITNVAWLDDSNTGISDADQTNNTSTAQIHILESDLEVSVSHEKEYIAGEDNTIEVHIVNNGPDAASMPTVVHDTLPAGFSYTGPLGDLGDGWDISIIDNVVTATYNGEAVPSGSNFPDLILPVSLDEALGETTLTHQLGIENEADYTPVNNNIQEDITVKSPIGLPVGLTEFRGYRSGKVNVLNWATATEINNKQFNVERSVDGGITWTTIASISGHGSTNSMQHYLYKDNEGALFEVASYRLQQVNWDGLTRLLDKIVTVTGEKKAGLQIMPNPARSVFTLSGLHQGDHIMIYTVSGKLVRQLKAASTVQKIEIADLAKGLYFIKVVGSGKPMTSKLIVQ